MLKTVATKKLFYRKYPFKICCRIVGASQVKYRGADWVVHRYNGLSQDEAHNRYGGNDLGWKPRSQQIDYPDLVLFARLVKKWIKDSNIHIRCEGSRYNLCCLDLKTYEKILKDLTPWVVEVTRPETKEDLEFFTKNGPAKILVKELPHSAFKYKIVMKPSMTSDRRSKFNNWLSKYDIHPKAISRNTQRWLSNNVSYIQDPFFYVENDEMLTIINLYLGNVISRTEEFVVRNKEEQA